MEAAGGDSGDDCQQDGVDTSCSMVQNELGSGAAVQCPDNACEGVNGNNQPIYFAATTNGTGSYYTYSGPGSMFYSAPAAASGAFGYIFDTYGNAGNGTFRQEYGGDVYSDGNGLYSYTDPLPGDNICTIDTVCSFDPTQVVDPSGTSTAGLYHTHPFGGGITDPDDYFDSFQAQVPTFVGIPQGTMFWYYPPPAGQPMQNGTEGQTQW